MNVLVTGVAGFIGHHVAVELLQAGMRVAGIDNFLTGRPENVPAGVTFTHGDLDDLHDHDLHGVDVLVHLAAVASARWPRPDEVWRHNLGAAAHAFRLARRAHARIVFASTAAADEPLSSPYAGAKWAAERLALADHATVLRFANVYGPLQRDWGPEPGVLAAWLRALREHQPLTVYGDGQQTRDFIHVHDVARAVTHAVIDDAADGLTIDICTGQQTPLLPLARQLGGRIEYAARPAGEPDAIVQDPEPAHRLLGFTATPGVRL